MAHLHRLMLALVLLAWSVSASAGWRMTWSSGVFKTREQGCNLFVSDQIKKNPTYTGATAELFGAGTMADPGSCYVKTPNGSYQNGDVFTMEPTSGGPVQDWCEGMASVKASWKMTGSALGSTPATACYMPFPAFEGADAAKGCVVSIGDSIAVPKADGTRAWSASGVATGGVCENAPDIGPQPEAQPNKCPTGFPGTVNGAEVCVPSVPDAGIEGVKTTESTTAAGVKTKVTEETSCNAGVCTTRTTTQTYNAAGTLTGTVVGATVKEPIGTKCTKDPGNAVCSTVGLGNPGNTGTGTGSGSGGGEAGPSSFDGSCTSGFKAVSDDAVINAMAEETFRQNCKLNPDDASQTLAKAEAAKTGNQTEDNPNNSTASVGPGNFDTSDAIGGGAGCIADKSVTIAGSSFLLPLSVVCNSLEALGMVLLACSFLLAGRIVTRG